ncbi:RraA family protein [Egibacter rhizosphaerae]|uniref:RraA family protein n=1 Tax=Egibacter rhizosphaerae TaxID=1670831 RepID=UPI0013F16637|nr:RraA family protein [Egibacter rhizosphaerae]
MNRCRIHPATPRPDESVVSRLRELPTTIVSDQLERAGAMHGLHPITGPELGILAGPAFTVRTRPGDNLAIYKAIDLIEPGDVLVIDGGGATDRAIAGEIVCLHAASQGAAGIVADGVVRDVADIARGSLPVYARGASPLGPYKSGPGELRGPISVGGTAVRQGDFIVGDPDGVVVARPDRIDDIFAGAQAQLAKEERSIAQARAGELDTSWLDAAVDLEMVDHMP